MHFFVSPCSISPLWLSFFHFFIDLRAISRHFMCHMASQYTIDLNAADARDLKKKLQERAGYEPAEREYTEFCFAGPKVNVAYYAKRGKLVVQGSGADEFLEFVMLIDPKTGESAVKKSTASKVDKSPHFGVDESGKGDYFGPLVVCCAYTDEALSAQMQELGIKDCKQMSDKDVLTAGAKARAILGPNGYSVVKLGPAAYNRLYAKMRNIN